MQLKKKNILSEIPRNQRQSFSVYNPQSRNKNTSRSNLVMNMQETLSDGSKIFIFHKHYLYKKKLKTLIMRTTLDLRVNKNINFWIENSKTANDEWEIGEWNVLSISSIDSCISETRALQPKTQAPKKQPMNIKKELKLDTKESPEYSELKTTIQAQQHQIEELKKKHLQPELTIEELKKEILELKHEKETQQLRSDLDFASKEKKWMIEKIKKLERQKKLNNIQLNDNDFFRVRTYCGQDTLKILDPITENGQEINVYEIRYGSRGASHGPKTVLCRTKRQLAVGDELRFIMPENMRLTDIWEINDQNNKIAVTRNIKGV